MYFYWPQEYYQSLFLRVTLMVARERCGLAQGHWDFSGVCGRNPDSMLRTKMTT